MRHQAQRWVYFFGQGHADGSGAIRHILGGKGASLADMSRAGFNVPPGFTIAAECCALFFESRQKWPDGLLDEIRANLRRLEEVTGRSFGRGANPLTLAVRSGAAESMPGMMDTILNVGLDRHASPVGRWTSILPTNRGTCWKQPSALSTDRGTASGPSPTAAHHQLNDLQGTAVNVQMMCPADVSGVLFTANPVNQALDQMIIESCHGSGEAVVSGKVTPDRFVLAKSNLTIADRSVAGNATAAGQNDGQSVAVASLHDYQILELGKLGLRVEACFGYPCDIEWALAQDQFFLLQARAIHFATSPAATGANAGADSSDLDRVRREEIDALQAKAAPGGTVWSRFNLAEILPEPTPMTWAIVRQFMSGKGGFGLMYRDLGFDPDPALDDEGIFDLVCGRPYCNLSREPRMQYRDLPFEHDFAAVKANPANALYPHATFNPAHARWRFWLFLPVIFLKVWRSSVKVRRLARTFATDFQQRIVPLFLKEVEAAAAEPLASLANDELLDRLHFWIKRTLCDFARDSLKPTALAGIAMANAGAHVGAALSIIRSRCTRNRSVRGERRRPSAL